ncbi:hypothetical protein PM082_022101 [Marasmius tenuissimus]|nr:hypothetical protein PM082_022101 [Marasmius tenuissimus]
MPPSMTDDLARVHKITAESSSLPEIMEAAISLEQSEKAREYYLEARRRLERSRLNYFRSRSRSSSRSLSPSQSREPRNHVSLSNNQVNSPEPFEQYEKHSTTVEQRCHNNRARPQPRDRDDNKRFESKSDRRDNKRRTYQSNPPRVTGSKSQSHDRSYNGKFLRATDDNGKEQFYHIVEVSDQPISHDNSTPEANSLSPAHSPGSYFGSQYTSDEEQDERVGLMIEDGSSVVSNEEKWDELELK